VNQITLMARVSNYHLTSALYPGAKIMNGQFPASGSTRTPEIDIKQAYFELLHLRRLVREAKMIASKHLRRSRSADLLLGLQAQPFNDDERGTMARRSSAV
jgi:hypothetical protein